ncbi:restriction endonuclease [Micromonospora rifamycinica]|uniref:restriction endonuclease n=1 Tax=Micromonospora rifamycinica TaxID=291594 RepID=UPI0033C8B1FD
MKSTDHLGINVQLAAIAVCRDAFHWRDDLRALFLNSGVARGLYDKYDDLANSKAKIARLIFDDLSARGPSGRQVQRKIVEELCRLSKPHRDAPDQAAGARALADLKREALSAQILVDPEKAAADARRAANERRATAVVERLAKLGGLRDRFLALSHLSPRSNGERQRRGYDFERLLADLFRLYDLEYRPSYRVEGEQIDGAFHFRGFTYLTEAKWRELPPDFGDLADFKAKVDGKMESTRGVFISMAMYDRGAVDRLVHIVRGTRNNVILMDGRDIARLFEGSVGLVDLLTAKIDAAEHEGRMWHEL